MPYARPTLAELIRASEADIDAALPGADARMPASNLNVMARVFAGALHGVYGYLDWLALQPFPSTAEAEILDRRAAEWGLTRKPAAPATGTVTVTGNDGVVVPTGWRLQRGDGAVFTAVTTATIAGGAASVTVLAEQPGAAGDTAAGVVLRAVSPVSGARSDAVVGDDGLAAGTDSEGDEGLRARLLERIRLPPHGGAKHDYAAWTAAVPGVDATRIWVMPRWIGAGTVGVTFLAVGPEIPGPALVAAVRAAIDEAGPVTAEAVVFAPAATPVPVGLSVSPDTPELRMAATAALDAFFWGEATPGGVLRLSRLSAAISRVSGIDHHSLTAPAGDVVLEPGHIATRGPITWGA